MNTLEKWPTPPLLLAALLVLGCDSNSAGLGGSSDAALGDGGAATDALIYTNDGWLNFEQCVELTEIAKHTYQPVDVVFVIDNTKSMVDELAAVRAAMNDFSQTITQGGLDAHIALISILPWDCDTLQTRSCHGICIEPPLGASGACANDTDDTQLPRYLHVSTRVQSTKTLSNIVATHDRWKAILRPGSTRHFVLISDDGDEMGAEQFNAQLLALDPDFAGYRFHGIFSSMSKEPACAAGHPCCDYAAPGGEGAPYKALVQLTGGVSSDLCQQVFAPVFQQIGANVIQGARLNCSWPLPAPPEGEKLDHDLVNVAFVEGNQATPLGRVDGPSACGQVTHGWYYDSAASPSQILVCPQTCDWIQGKPDSQMQLHLGCESQRAPVD